MEQIKKYIRGNSERCKEVIAKLEKLGGKNTPYLRGDNENVLYFIEATQNVIDTTFLDSLTGQLILTHPDWEEIKLPEQFKDGDVLSNGICICIYNGNESENHYGLYVGVGHIDYPNYFIGSTQNSYFTKKNAHLATEEEKQKLFKAIKDNGYKWNPETKTLEKMIEPKFKVGDRIKDRNNRVWFVVQVSDKYFDISSVPNAEGYFVPIEDQDKYELVPNKFDISTLVPFESRVLVRDNKSERWFPAVWGLKNDDIYYPYIIVGGGQYSCCIPYESNKHLLGTTNDCDEYYKTWEE